MLKIITIKIIKFDNSLFKKKRIEPASKCTNKTNSGRCVSEAHSSAKLVCLFHNQKTQQLVPFFLPNKSLMSLSEFQNYSHLFFVPPSILVSKPTKILLPVPLQRFHLGGFTKLSLKWKKVGVVLQNSFQALCTLVPKNGSKRSFWGAPWHCSAPWVYSPEGVLLNCSP